MEECNIHTNHFHVPQWLPLTAVPFIYRSVSERMQHLTYTMALLTIYMVFHIQVPTWY